MTKAEERCSKFLGLERITVSPEKKKKIVQDIIVEIKLYFTIQSHEYALGVQIQNFHLETRNQFKNKPKKSISINFEK